MNELPQLSDIEARILGALIEKQHTTPDLYPLTLNALHGACNQKTSRDPVSGYTPAELEETLRRLLMRQFVAIDRHGRADKYAQLLTGKLELSRSAAAIVAVLLLRGPQTVGELRQRCDRIFSFASLEDVEDKLATLAALHPPLVEELPREPGRKENRYTQRLYDAPAAAGARAAASDTVDPAVHMHTGSADPLDERVSRLEAELAQLREELNAFKAQFE